MKQQTKTPTQPHRTHDASRRRPRWAQVIHNLGDDLRWALSAWCDFPRPVTRLTTAVVSAAGAYALDLDDTVQAFITTLTD